MFAEWIGILAPFVLYYLYLFIKYKCQGKTFFTKADSMYYVEDEDNEGQYKFACNRLCATFKVGFIALLVLIVIITAFYFADLSGMNPGIVASTFASNTLFICIAFFIAFGQKLTCKDIIGCLLITACVVIVALSKEKHHEDKKASSKKGAF